MKRDIIIIILIVICGMSAIKSDVRVQVRRVGSARVTPRPIRLREWIQ